MTLLSNGLPQLGGRAGAAVRALYVAFAALTMAMLAYGGWLAGRDFFVVVPNNLEFGFATATGTRNFPDPNQVRIYQPTSEAARQSGVRLDDIIVSIEGAPVASSATEHDVGDRMGAITGPTATIVTRSSDGTLRTHVLPRQEGAWNAVISGTGLSGWQRSLLLFGAEQTRMLFLLGAALLLFRRRGRDPVALLFGTACLAMCHYGNNSFWFWHMAGWLDAQSWASLVQFLCLAVGLNVFPDGRFSPRWTRWLALAAVPTIAGCYMLARAQLVSGVAVSYLVMGILLVSIAGLILRYRATAAGPERQQIKWAVAGFVGYVLLLVAGWIPYLIGVPLSGMGAFGFVTVVLLSTATALSIAAGLLVSLLRYRLYDADAAISRSASYSFLTLLLVTLFAATRQGIEILGARFLEGNAAALSGGVAAAIVAIMITPLHHRITQWSEERFQKPLVALRRGLPELAGDLRETAKAELIARATLERIESGVRAVRAAIVLHGAPLAVRGVDPQAADDWLRDHALADSDRIERSRGDPLFPVRVALRQEGVGTIGWLLLGPRPDGSLYPREERKVLNEVRGPVARALHIACERSAATERRERAARRLAARLAVLTQRVEALERDRDGLAAAAE